MTAPLSRAIMRLAVACFGARHREWSLAMQAEFETAVDEGRPLRFATGCLLAAGRAMVTNEEGRFALSNYAFVLVVLLPMAALQIGCALFGLPYLYPGQHGLAGALLEGGTHQDLVRGIYQGAVPALALLQLLIGAGHVRMAWLLLEQDWDGVARLGIATLSATVTLILLMTVLFLDSSQAWLQASVLAVELATIAVVVWRHAQLMHEMKAMQPG